MKFISSFLLIVAGLFYATGLNGQTYEIFSTPGAGTFEVPCGVTSITVHLYGGGGGGGGCNTNSIGGGGGGAGAYTSWTWGAVVPGTIYNFVVGSGGAAGAPGFNGGNGSQSSWDGGILFANGGTGGFGENFGGGGGTGGVGSGWANTTNGGNGNNGTPISGGLGGSILAGPNGGSGGPGGGVGAPGGNGANFGGGGGGGGNKNGGFNPPGGLGASGAVIVEYTLPYPVPDAGPDVSTCNVIMLQANTPGAGWTGTWSVVANSDPPNPPVISDINDPNATVTITNPGNCVTLQWTFTQPGCATMSDQVQVCYPLLCNDDPCGAIPLTVNSGGCSYTTYSNNGATASTGMVEPGCGSYLDNDAWYSATVPANGVLHIQTTDAAGGTAMTMSMAIYEGPNCSTLEHAGCDPAASAAGVAELTYLGTPGETVWIRIWEVAEQENNYNICAFSPAVSTGDVLSGSTTIACGSSLTFMDPGGPGNYPNNSGGAYIICPDTPGQYVSIDFSTGPFNLESGNDYLTILDGDTDSSIMIGQFNGSTNPGVITASHPDGCLTVIFQSDNAVNLSGWVATVTCSAVAGVNDTLCSPTNCTGECGQWICDDGLYPTTNDGNAAEDLAITTSGCFTSTGEIASKWFYFTALTAGSIEFSFNGPNGQDYNLAVWGPSTNGIPPCPQNTEDSPIRCSMADVQSTGNPVGLSVALGGGEAYEGLDGDGWVDALYVQPGETYAMILNIFQNGNPQPVIDMTIGGSGTLDCLPVFLPVTLLSFNGMNQGAHNLLHWTTNVEVGSDYFTVERSVNGFDWEIVGTTTAAGNSESMRYYEMRDENPYFPVTYYRLKQTDYNSQQQYFDVISVNADKALEGDLISNLFPNPAESYVTFTYNGFDTQTPLTVQVVNEMGAVVIDNDYDNTYNGMPSTLRIDDLATGLYQVVFTQGDRRVIKKLSIIK